MAMMKKCSYCGSQFDAALAECPYCGGRAIGHVCLNCGTEYDGAVCPKCGVRFDDEGRVCPKCGARMFKTVCATCGYNSDITQAAASTAKKAVSASASLIATLLVGMVGFVFPPISNLVFFFGRKFGKIARWFTAVWSLFFAWAMLRISPADLSNDPAEMSIGTYRMFGGLTLLTLGIGLFVLWRRLEKEKRNA